ncbi:hypothetical protein RQP46_010614 [Phenoliferia psychrophenolica]
MTLYGQAFSAKTFQYCCAASANAPVGDFLPPMSPRWTPQETVDFMKSHHMRIAWGGSILMVGGAFYIPLSCGISTQMRRIPNLHVSIPMVQAHCGSASVWTFMIPGIIVCVANFDLDRPIEITQAFIQLFWIGFFMAWPTFFIQNFAFAFAILADTREKPLFPKWIIGVNTIIPILFIPATACHVTKTGPIAWDGIMSFWVPGCLFSLQVFIESACLARAVYYDDDHEKGIQLNETDSPRTSQLAIGEPKDFKA